MITYFHQGRNWKNSDETKGYSAIVQWTTFHYATSCLNFFESFENVGEYSKITACVALPDIYIVDIPFPVRPAPSYTGVAEIIHHPHPKRTKSKSTPQSNNKVAPSPPNPVVKLEKTSSKPIVEPETASPKPVDQSKTASLKAVVEPEIASSKPVDEPEAH